MKFEEVISKDNALKLFDDLHYIITRRDGYWCSEKVDGSGEDDEWYTFRMRLIFSGARGLIEEKDLSSYTSIAVDKREKQLDEERRKFNEKFTTPKQH